MEYNYTREFKQPHKIYAVRGHTIPWAPNGIRFEHLIVGGILVILTGSIWLLGLITRVTLVQSFFANEWLLILAGIGVLVWTLFSLKWDHKNFFDYVMGRSRYALQKKKRYEHELVVTCLEEPVTYQVKPREFVQGDE